MERWREALSIFGRICASLAEEGLGESVAQAADDPNDCQALYESGYQLIERNLGGIAGTVLARANRLVPDQEYISFLSNASASGF